MSHADAPVPPGFAGPDTPVGGLSLRPAIKVGRDVSIQGAAALMRREDVSALIVETEPESFVTERDLTRALAEEIDPSEPVTIIATRAPVWAPSTITVAHAAAVMVRFGLRHLVVVADSGEAASVLSIRDAFAILLSNVEPSGWLAGFASALGDVG